MPTPGKMYREVDILNALIAIGMSGCSFKLIEEMKKYQPLETPEPSFVEKYANLPMVWSSDGVDERKGGLRQLSQFRISGRDLYNLLLAKEQSRIEIKDH